MNDRREDEQTVGQTALPIPIDKQKKGEDLKRKLKDGELKLFEAEKIAEEKITQAQQVLAQQGTAITIAQQNALLILAIHYFTISLLTMFILQLNTFGWLLTWLPFLKQVSGTIYFGILFIVEFCPNTIQILPFNIFFFFMHTGSKVLLFVFVSLWYQQYRCELIFMTFGVSILYLMYIIKNCDEQSNAIRVRSQFLNVTIMAGIISGFLCLLAQQNFFIIGILIVLGVLYVSFLQLALQRFEQHEFIMENRNDIYLGAAQIDADLFLICKLVAYHCFQRNESKLKSESEDLL